MMVFFKKSQGGHVMILHVGMSLEDRETKNRSGQRQLSPQKKYGCEKHLKSFLDCKGKGKGERYIFGDLQDCCQSCKATQVRSTQRRNTSTWLQNTILGTLRMP